GGGVGEGVVVGAFGEEHLNSSVKGVDQCYTSTLLYLVSIHLSSNNKSGEIPSELVNLIELRNLNLSGNCLEGKIPDKIGHLKNLESLDPPKNQLSRNIPISMSNLNYLSHLNLSYNNLTRRIPIGNQLHTLDNPSIYANNKFL
nr:LRR receptor-like serine/threonine-protein kinase FLS2 [Tanacetum cinerariifolium]